MAPYSQGMAEIHAVRRAAVRKQLAELGADAALITSGVNVRYLTGLVSSNAALLLPADGQAVLATDSRYAGTAASQCADLELLIERLIEPVAGPAGRGPREYPDRVRGAGDDRRAPSGAD